MKTIYSILGATLLATGAHAIEVEPLTYESDIFNWPSQAITKKYERFDWMDLETDRNDLTLFGKKISGVELVEPDEVIQVIKFKLLTDGSAFTPNEFKKEYAKWGKLIQKSISGKGKTITPYVKDGVTATRYAWNFDKSVVVLSQRLKKDTPQDITLEIYRKDLGFAYLKDRGDVTTKKPPARKGSDRGSGSGRSQQSKMMAKVKEILRRPAPRGISKKHNDAVNLLNAYRYLSGVPYNVSNNAKLHAAALDAATACKKHGGLSHDLGHSTDKSNLAMNTGGLTMANSVTQYIDDSGDNNREKRGHRRWCFNPPMGKVGFGINGAYSAMYCFDMSGRSNSKNFGYPGIGQYPIKYLHGNAWSYYLAKGNAPTNPTVEVYKLRKEMEKPPRWSKDPDGKKLPCEYVHSYMNTINFEPQPDPVTKKGCYLVRIKGSGFKEQYIVNLF